MDRNSVLCLALICIAIAVVGARSPKTLSPNVSLAHSQLEETLESSPPPAPVPESSPSDNAPVKPPSAPAPAPHKPKKGRKKNKGKKKHHAPSPSPSEAPAPSPDASAPNSHNPNGAESIRSLKKVLGFLALGWTTLVLIF